MDTLSAQFALLGLVFLVVGILAKWKPPKRPNLYYGYRLSSAKKSQAHWGFAQEYYPRQMISFGAISLILAFMSVPAKVSELAQLGIILVWLFGGILWIVIPTELAIKRAFDEDD